MARKLVLRRSLMILLCCVSLLSSSCGKTPSLQRISSNDTIVAFGDSLTFGTGAASQQDYPSQLSTLIHRTVINAGVPGEISQTGLARLPNIINQYQPKLLLICHGGNDILQKIPAQETERNLREMITLAKQQHIDVVIIAVSGLNLWAKPLPFYADIAKEFNLPIELNIIQALQKDASMKSDRVHFNAVGYQKMAESIKTLLIKSNAINE